MKRALLLSALAALLGGCVVSPYYTSYDDGYRYRSYYGPRYYYSPGYYGYSYYGPRYYSNYDYSFRYRDHGG